MPRSKEQTFAQISESGVVAAGAPNLSSNCPISPPPSSPAECWRSK